MQISEIINKSWLPRLEIELILEHHLHRSREWILGHINSEISNTDDLRIIIETINRRRKGEPLAYIFGHREFYGREFIVTPDVLIPRPETEFLIDVVKKWLPEQLPDDGSRIKILDVGTGSGAIAVTLNNELSNVQIYASDISVEALMIAQKNAGRYPGTHNPAINFLVSDLLVNITEKFDLIVANLPYVDRNWEWNKGIDHEPDLALYADDGGLELIKKLVAISPNYLYSNGYLLLEMDTSQLNAVSEFAQKHLFLEIARGDFWLLLSYTATK